MFFRYQPPSLAITTLYWKAWTILLILAAFNPGSFGKKSSGILMKSTY